ncbi:MAG: precorrin-2 C(20)-methyltransferase [Alphaproteobacteria bacterium]|nr:MAG: precorrin-2 C(20)-methyltransferase [Alphaproteobacteria bacterium]
MTGTLYAIGLGPGDPELMTLKAARLIASCPVVAWPAADGKPSRARAVAEGVIAAQAVEIAIDIPMRSARAPAQSVYDRAAAEIGGHLDAGCDVALLCLGDPLFYGSAMYLQARLAERHPCEVVPGVTALSACTAVAGLALTARGEALRVLPAGEDVAAIVEAVGRGEALAVMKLGRHVAAVRDALEQAGALGRAVYVAEASMPGQTVLPLAEAPDPAPYFSMALVAGGRDPWAR